MFDKQTYINRRRQLMKDVKSGVILDRKSTRLNSSHTS